MKTIFKTWSEIVLEMGCIKMLIFKTQEFNAISYKSSLQTNILIGLKDNVFVFFEVVFAIKMKRIENLNNCK